MCQTKISVICVSGVPLLRPRLQKSFLYHAAYPNLLEFIVIENEKEHLSITKGYNRGIKLSTGEILCFSHDDTLIHTYGWDERVQQWFKAHSEVGLIGIWGGTAFPAVPAPWWNDRTVNQWVRFAIGTRQEEFPQVEMSGWQHLPSQPQIREVAVVDGAWFCMRREVAECVCFDENLPVPFHGYDSDICLGVWAAGWRVAVVNNIAVEHPFTKRMNMGLARAWEYIAEKWQNLLPLICTEPKPPDQQVELWQVRCLLYYAYCLQSWGAPDRYIRQQIRKYAKRIHMQINCREALLLWGWAHLGYQLNRPLHRIAQHLLP